MAPSSNGLTFGAEDPRVHYTESEKRVLSANLRPLLRAIHTGELNSSRIAQELLQHLHAALFTGVRDFAGRLRTRYFGAEVLVFGAYHSCHRREVPARLKQCLLDAAMAMDALPEPKGSREYKLAAITCAVRAHAQVISIHPFEDGNGRTSRMFCSCLLVRAGLPATAVEAPTREYIDGLNHFHDTGDIEPLVHLYVRMAVDQIPFSASPDG